MKALVTVSLVACLSGGALADDLSTATPSPTPYLGALPRPAAARRIQRSERQRAREAQLESQATAREQAKRNRRATAAAKAQARETARARERAQRQLDAEARREKAREVPRPTSDLMKRMGFSDEEIAKQKALEASPKPQASPSPGAKK